MPFFCLLGRLRCGGGGGGCAFLRLGLAGYGVMITPHGLLDLLEVGTVLVSVREERGGAETGDCDKWKSQDFKRMHC